jgi:transposase
LLLLPPNLREWLPSGHLAYFIADVVEDLDLSAITQLYERELRGYPPYHTVMIVKVLLYGYAIGVRSSRRLARAVWRTWRSACWQSTTRRTSAR